MKIHTRRTEKFEKSMEKRRNKMNLIYKKERLVKELRMCVDYAAGRRLYAGVLKIEKHKN